MPCYAEMYDNSRINKELSFLCLILCKNEKESLKEMINFIYSMALM